VDGLDVPGRIGRISERPAQIADAGGERGVAHGGVAPDARQQRLLRDQLSRVLDQVLQHRECPGHQRQPLGATPGGLVLGLDPDRGHVARSRWSHVESLDDQEVGGLPVEQP
jgi:hypothetical protein